MEPNQCQASENAQINKNVLLGPSKPRTVTMYPESTSATAKVLKIKTINDKAGLQTRFQRKMQKNSNFELRWQFYIVCPKVFLSK